MAFFQGQKGNTVNLGYSGHVGDRQILAAIENGRYIRGIIKQAKNSPRVFLGKFRQQMDPLLDTLYIFYQKAVTKFGKTT